MPEADETIITRFVVEAEDAINGTKTLRSNIDEIKVKLRELATATKESFDVAAKALKEAEFEKLQGLPLKQIKDEMKAFGDASSVALKELKQEMGSSSAESQSFLSRLGELGTVGKYVFGTIFGLGAVQAIRKVIEIFKEAINASLEFQKSLFTLEVAVRGLQRIGLETTIESWETNIKDLKKQFPIFSRKEFTDATSLAALMTREFGFTEAQIADVVRQSAILAEITGKDLNEAVRGITFAIGSGYFESLQRAGINISRQVVANEALAQGYKGVYNELEPTIRAQLTYSVIQKNLNAIQQDAGAYVETTAGQVQRLKASLQDLLIVLGQVVTGTEDARDTIAELAGSVEAATALIDLLAGSEDKLALSVAKDIAMYGLFPGVLIAVSDVIRSQFNTAVDAAKQKLDDLGWSIDNITQNFRNLLQLFGINADRILGNLEEGRGGRQPRAIGAARLQEEERIADLAKEVIQGLNEEINQIDDEWAAKNLDIWEEWGKDRVDIWEKYQDRLADLEGDLANRLADIDIKEQQRIEDEVANNAYRVAEAIRQANFRKAEAERKYREREISSERKFQEKLRQLRENFLLDLEDAVRERDARQIIRLTRQYNLRREQMTREEKLNKTDRQAQFEEELRQIEQQKQERLRQLAIEHQRRLQEIAIQAERERAQAQVDFERRQADEQARYEQEKLARDERRDEQLADLDAWKQERINKVVEGIREERDLSERELVAIGNLWDLVYGPNGYVDNAITYSLNRMAQLIAFQRLLNQQKFAPSNFVPPQQFGPEYNYAGGQAEGGTIVARKPTVAIFGDAGPEMATFTPLNKLPGESAAKITPADVSSAPRDGMIKLELLLSPDLEARVIDNTLGQMADINFAIERARK